MRSIRLLAAATFILVLGSGCGDGGGVEPGNDPVAEFTVGACTAGTPCAFTDASTDPDGNQTITSRAWDFGDPASGTANTSTETSPSHTFAAANTYNVKLTVTDNSGKTSVKTNPVVVAAATGTPPVASFDLPTNCTAGTPCGFHSTSTDADGTIDATLWEFGDTETAEGADATHTFAAAGTYGVKLTVTDNQGNPGSVTQQVVVSPAASQGCTTSGTVVNCSLSMSGRVTVKFVIVSRSCELSGNSIRVTAPVDKSIFFNLCNRSVGEEQVVTDNTGAPVVFAAGTAMNVRFNQGVAGPSDPPTGDPGIRITGAFPNWTLNIDDGGAAGTQGEPDFDDAVISVQATTAP
jgi:PKD repeat protein